MSSIYWKDCPHCGTNQPVSALYCACGYCFEPEQLEGTVEALELQAHEEQLYYEYLSARLDQARATHAGVAPGGNPTDRYYDALASEGARLLRAAEAELALQSKRVAEARGRVEQARAGGAASVRDRVPATRPPETDAGFRAGQARKAAIAVAHQRSPEAAKCPRCTAILPAGASRCGLCGCRLGGSAPVPSGLLGALRATARARRRSA